MAVRENLLAAGGFQGELICKYLDQPGVVFYTKVTNDENAVTNSVVIYQDMKWEFTCGSTLLMAANNDCSVRIFYAQNFALLNQFTFPWSVNSTSVSPDSKLLAVVGDDVDCLVADAKSGKEGRALKVLATAARLDVEDFLQKKVFLEVEVKVKENWRQDEGLLKHYGYSGQIRVLILCQVVLHCKMSK